MMQFHEVHEQLCCASRVEAAQRALGRLSPGLSDCDFCRVTVSLWVGLLPYSCLLFSERCLFAYHQAAHHVLGAREHPRKALPVLMVTAVKNPVKAGFCKALYKVGQVPREEQARVAQL